ncbi:class C sortase [uncultured Anaerococcus sp.]|uniref:class C sortase n=1 Tax=uncultured Anaerococcus sp. TaxID=293428 RepID=UPI002621966F|nr:class C sortase [uncultured Anaerococcus sp.]
MKNRLRLTKTSTIGYLLILLGLLFITIPLIRRTANDYSAAYLQKNFEELQETRDPSEIAAETENAKEYNEVIKKSDISIVDPFTAGDYQTRYEKFTKTNIPFAYLSIPKLDKHLPLYLDATLDHISKGVAQVDGSSIPVGGPGTRSVIAGHRGWWTDTYFLYLDQLKEGDYVYVERAEETMRYVVHDKEVIDPYDWDKLAPRGEEDILTLLTCSPFMSPRPNRLLVNCYRDEGAIAEEFDIPGKELAKSQDQANGTGETTDTMVKVTRIITLIFALLGIALFVIVLIRFINRIQNTIS